MNKGYLLTGGNLGDRATNLSLAREILNQSGILITSASPIFETAAWGQTEQPAFLNQALEVETRWDALQLLSEVWRIEKKIGRVRDTRYGPRVIDIDILLFNDEVYALPELKIPHPELHNRRFALAPLAAIAGSLLHPILGKSINELLKESGDQLEVAYWQG